MISISSDVAAPQAKEAAVNAPMQIMKNRLRPSTSDSQPESGSTIPLATR